MRFVGQRISFVIFVCLSGQLQAQDPVGVLEGHVTDSSGGSVSTAEVTASNRQTAFSAKQHSADDGSFHFSSLPVGEYDLHVGADGFAAFTASAIRIDIGRTVRVPVRSTPCTQLAITFSSLVVAPES